MTEFLAYVEDFGTKYRAAERFVDWLNQLIVSEARGDEVSESTVDPTGRFWLGRLGPKDFVTKQDERGDRLEPCAIGVRLRLPAGPLSFTAKVRAVVWSRHRAQGTGQRWSYSKSEPLLADIPISLEGEIGEYRFGRDTFAALFRERGGEGLSAEVRVQVSRRDAPNPTVEITFVNTSPELEACADGRLFQCSLEVCGLTLLPFELEALPDSFRYNRKVMAFGLNCGVEVDGQTVRTSDSPARSRMRPSYWAVATPCPDLTFETLSRSPIASCEELILAFENWAGDAWGADTLNTRSAEESWSPAMRREAERASKEFSQELKRVKEGLAFLRENAQLRSAFQLMNKAMSIAARGRYDSWRPFQFAFLLANLKSIVDPVAEQEIVDVVWFATGGGKTETYLGLLVTAALWDRMRGKISGVTAWSRFPLRLLSLQQTQRFANALAAAEIVRKEAALPGDPFSLGFLVGSSSTPNRIKKESNRDNEDASKVEEMDNPFRVIDVCPFCRVTGVKTRFDRRTWRLVHCCENAACPNGTVPLPIFVIDDEIWRFLPTVVVGTLDKAANIARQTGMRGLVGAPWGLCGKVGHGYTYATRGDFPNGCLVPDCRGKNPEPLPMDAALFAPTFRLQDELHLLRDSLGAVDAHYEAALDSLQEELSGSRPKILASSATLAGYEKQADVLYHRSARVFPQPSPREGSGFWTSDSNELMRRYIALAPRRLTVEFVVDRLVVTIQSAIRDLLREPQQVCGHLNIDTAYAPFLANLYGTNVVYGNTLQDIDAVVRSSETQYAGLDPSPNVETLTGRTDFDDVLTILKRLEQPEQLFEDRIHLIAASSMMSHGVDIDRLNVMVMLAFPLGVAEFIQATARVGRRWPGLVVVVPKMTRERDASLYRSFPQFVSHGDRFVEAIPITRKSRRVLERTVSGIELSRLLLVHEPSAEARLITLRDLNTFLRSHPDALKQDEAAIARALALTDDDELLQEQLNNWFKGFQRNLREPPGDARFFSDLSPTGAPMLSLRDVEEQVPILGDSTQ